MFISIQVHLHSNVRLGARERERERQREGEHETHKTGPLGGFTGSRQYGFLAGLQATSSRPARARPRQWPRSSRTSRPRSTFQVLKSFHGDGFFLSFSNASSGQLAFCILVGAPVLLAGACFNVDHIVSGTEQESILGVTRFWLGPGRSGQSCSSTGLTKKGRLA